jgi:hypothetical protein
MAIGTVVLDCPSVDIDTACSRVEKLKPLTTAVRDRRGILHDLINYYCSTIRYRWTGTYNWEKQYYEQQQRNNISYFHFYHLIALKKIAEDPLALTPWYWDISI